MIDDDGGVFPDNTCSGNCEVAPPPPPTPGTPCESNCMCNGVDLTLLAEDPTHKKTHHARDKYELWCYMFSVCGPIASGDLPDGCQNHDGEGIAALRYKCEVSLASGLGVDFIATPSTRRRLPHQIAVGVLHCTGSIRV